MCIRTQRRFFAPKGFTLIELLVVVAIIALLVSILLPSLGRAKELAKQTMCGSNQRNIGTALQQYAAENGGRFPLAISSAFDAWSDEWYDAHWFNAIAEFSGGEPGSMSGQDAQSETNMYICPSAKVYPKFLTWGIWAVSYMSNDGVLVSDWSGNMSTTYSRAANPDLIERPQEQMTLVDGCIGANPGWPDMRVAPWDSSDWIWGDEADGSGSRVWYWHGGNSTVNVLCADGHVAGGVNAADGWKTRYQGPTEED